MCPNKCQVSKQHYPPQAFSPLAVGTRGQGTNILYPPGPVCHAGHLPALLWQPQRLQHMPKAQATFSSMENKIIPRKMPNPFFSPASYSSSGKSMGLFFKAALKHLATSQPLSCFSSPSLSGVDLWPPFEGLQQVNSSGIHMVLPRQRSSTHLGFLHLLPQAQSWGALLDFSALNL